MAYLFTMLFLMIKSLCSKVGIDNSKMFDARYMGLMANKIVEEFIF